MPAEDLHGHIYESLTGPLDDLVEITPDDVEELENVTRALYVGGTGDIHMITRTGKEVTLPNVQGGMTHPFRVRKVFDTGTDATGLFGGY